MPTVAMAVSSRADAPFSNHLIDTVSPSGTTVSLFDYWDTPAHENGNDYQTTQDPNGLINKDHYLKFTNGIGAIGKSINAWTSTGSAGALQGMVERRLDKNGFPVLSGTSGFTYDEKDSRVRRQSLAYLFDNSAQPGKRAYTNVSGLLSAEDGYYSYNSQTNFASFDKSIGSFNVYDRWGVKHTGNSPDGQFFPFNSADQVFDEDMFGNLQQKKNIDARSSAINHFFGLTMSTRFVQTENGKTDSGKDVTYDFSGDDDVWVFIDDVLVADLSGIHDAGTIKINFNTGKVETWVSHKPDGSDKVDYQESTIRQQFRAAGAESEAQWRRNTFADNTYHTLKFFYLERGNSDSNMKLKFNLVSVPESNAVKIDQHGQPLAGSTIELYAAARNDDNYTVRPDAQPITSGTTDGSGVLPLVDPKTDALLTFKELSEKYNTNRFVVREKSAAPGYRRLAKDIHVNYSEDTGVIYVTNYWDTGAYSTGSALVVAPSSMQAGPNGEHRITVAEDGTLVFDKKDTVWGSKDDGGTLFALPLYRTADNMQDSSSWRGIYGNAVQGWKLSAGDATNFETVIDAVRNGAGWAFVRNPNGQYEVDIDELPGAIEKYYYVIDPADRQEETKYALAFYYTTADSMKAATASNTYRVLDPEKQSSHATFDRQYAANFYIPNFKDRLVVQKVDELGNEVNGAKFKLESEDGTRSQTLITSKHSKKDGSIVEGNGIAVFGDDGTNPIKLTPGKYILTEVEAPEGYELNTEPVVVMVNEEGVYADAGIKDDGVVVSRGVGTLFATMKRFATDDDLDVTLQHIKADLMTKPSGGFAAGDWSAANPQQQIELKYDKASADKAAVEYVAEKDGDLAVIRADEGWSKLHITQNLPSPEPANAQDLGDRDITGLYSGSCVVRMENVRTGALEISKKVEGYNGISADDLSALRSLPFTFDVKLYQEDGTAPLEGTFDVKIAANGLHKAYTIATIENGVITKVFDAEGNEQTDAAKRITMTHGDKVSIEGLPVDTRYAVSEDDPGMGFTTTVEADGAKPVESLDASGSIGYTDKENTAVETDKVVYTNAYAPAPAMADVPGKKVLQGEGIPAGEYTFKFRLNAMQGNPAGDPLAETNGQTAVKATVVMDESGRAERAFGFEGLAFTHPGTYKYQMWESSANPIDGISYSQALYRVEIAVVDRGTSGFAGQLEIASVSLFRVMNDAGIKLDPTQELGENEVPVFTNTYSKLAAGFAINGAKVMIEDGEEIEPVSGAYTFELTPVGGVNIDQSEGEDAKVGPEGVPMPGGKLGGKATATNSGKPFMFPGIAFNMDNEGWTYTYEVREIKPSEGALPGVVYDQNVRTVKVTVAEKDGLLTVTPEYPGRDSYKDPQLPEAYGDNLDAVYFINTYDPDDLDLSLKGVKTLVGRDAKKGEKFTFELEADPVDAATQAALKDGSLVMPESPTATVAAEELNKADDSKGTAGFKFDSITISRAGTYRFLISEQVPAENPSEGMTYDTCVWNVVVTVASRDADNVPTGKLAVTSIAYVSDNLSSSTGAEFVNEYAASEVQIDFKGTKTMAGRDFKDGDSFTFKVTPDPSDAPMPANVDKNGQITVYPKSGSKVSIDFGSIAFDKTGTYVYEVQELADDLPGVGYDPTVHTVTIEVTDAGAGSLSARVASITVDGRPAEHGLAWTNTYTPGSTELDGKVNLSGTKHFVGREWTDTDEFTFVLEGADDMTCAAIKEGVVDLPGEGANESDSVTVTKKDLMSGSSTDAAFNFGNITFARATQPAAPYKFKISEMIPSETNGITYSKEVYTVQVTVKDDLNGKLVATVTATGGDAVWTNTYVPQPVSVPFEARKTLSGRDFAASEFTFELVDKGGEVLQTKTNAAPDASGVAKVEFDEIVFDKAGTYEYTIREVAGSASGVEYDRTKHKVVVTVTDNGKGALDASVAYDDSAESPLFENTYKAKPAADAPAAVKTVESIGGNDFTLEAGQFSFTLEALT